MKAEIYIKLKKTILDPQGTVISKTLENMGFGSNSVRVGKLINLEINENDKVKAENKIKEICENFLVNKLVEEYEFKIID